MKTFQYTSHSEMETMNFAYHLASKLQIGDIIILSGNLGAGKTKFTEGFLKYFHLENEISSPTFTIVNEYVTPTINIFHFDLYRLEDIDEFYAIGGDEYFDKGICIFEWGEILEAELKQKYIKISYEKDPINLEKRTLYVEEVNA